MGCVKIKKSILIFIAAICAFSANATCQKAYKAYRAQVLHSPISAPAISSTLMGQGAASTSMDLLRGAIQLDSGLSTAGTANGLAFTYEGHFYLELMSSNLRHFRGRSKVLRILNQAEIGLGEELEKMTADLCRTDDSLKSYQQRRKRARHRRERERKREKEIIPVQDR